MDDFVNNLYDKFGSIVGFSSRNLIKTSIFFVIMIIKQKFFVARTKLNSLAEDPEFTKAVEWKIKQQMELKDSAFAKTMVEIEADIQEEVDRMDKVL